MKKIYSKVNPDTLLHAINRLEDISPGRTDIAPEEQFIQLSALNMEKGKTFRPHRHIWKSGEEEVIAQESWVVLRGSVNVIMYDLYNSIIATEVLNAGDCSLTFCGGHNYKCLEDGTLVYEYKTGPYKGQENDKEFIE